MSASYSATSADYDEYGEKARIHREFVMFTDGGQWANQDHAFGGLWIITKASR